MKMSILIVMHIITIVYGYLDLQLQINRSKNQVSYGFPIQINNIDYVIPISLENNKQFIVPLFLKSKDKKKKSHKTKNSDLKGIIKAYSIQGYTLEGWKRFFQQALLFIQNHYSHQIQLNLQQIQQVQPDKQDNYKDGRINFGPNLQKNIFFNIIKANSDYVKQDIVSIYRKYNDKSVKIQLGGYEPTFAKGHHDGYLFYAFQLVQSQNKWKIPTSFLTVKRRGSSGKPQVFKIINSSAVYSMSLQSPLVKLPYRFSIDIQRSLQTAHSSCKVQNHRLLCTNISSNDLMLSYLEFCINQGAFINISLNTLIDNYNNKTNESVFNIEFTEDPNQFMIGQPLFQSYYVSIDMSKKKMTYSPTNNFPNPNYSVYVIRFVVGFFIFMVVSAVLALMWQMCSDIERKNKIVYGQKGVQIVSYQKPMQSQSFE